MIDRKEISRHSREVNLNTLNLYLQDQRKEARLAGEFFLRMQINLYLEAGRRKKFILKIADKFNLSLFGAYLLASRELFERNFDEGVKFEEARISDYLFRKK